MLKKCLFISFVILFGFSVSWSQKVDINQLAGLKMRNIGPAGMSGRVTAIDVDLTDSDIIYIGTSAGGVWKSTSGGIKWEPVFDDQPVQAIGAIAVNQLNTQEIWVGTGEGNPRNSHNSGAGIYKSLDGGKTWKLKGLKPTKNIHRIIVHPQNPNIVFVAALGSIWGPNEERGVYRTKDGGETWEKVLYTNSSTGVADLVIDPTNPNKLIAAMWEYGRKPWTFNSGGKGSGIHITYDGGNTWKKIDSKAGLPEGDLGRCGLAIAPSSPNVVYALVEAKENNLFKSLDGGETWFKTGDKNIGDRPFYYFDIFVDPKNENRVYSLFSRVSRSEDGGKTFDIILPYNHVHPDHHAFWVHPEDPNYLIEGNDGGLNISRDRGKTWQFIENIPVGQFYHVNYDMEIPYNIGGGMQDNGSWVGPAYAWKSGSIRNAEWQEVFFGDGFDVGFKPNDSRYVYAMSQGGNVGFIDRVTGKSKFIKPVHPAGEHLRFNWNAAFAQNPFHDCGIYYGSQFVHKSMDCGNSWEIISPDLTTNDPEKQKQYESGGLTIDNTQAENHTTILAIAPSPVDENVIWVGTDDGNLQLTKDGGKSWNNLSMRLPGVKMGSWIPYIEPSAKNAGEVLVVVNDYRRNDFRPMAFHSSDFGQTFKRIVDEKQVDGFVLSIVQDPVVSDLLWLGTDVGLYFSIDFGKNWNKWSKGFPSVQTADLKIHPREQDLIIGTFGRSFWIFDDTRPIREIAATKGKVLEQPFRVFEAPEAYLSEYRSYDGYHFPADALFEGQNKSEGAMVTIWANPSLKKEKKEDAEKGKGKDDKLNIQVYDNAGALIRTYSEQIDTGMTRIYWNLRKDGVRYPSYEDARPGSDTPSGAQVLPGNYKMVVTFGAHKDSTIIKVNFDPRLDYKMENLVAQQEAYKQYEGMVKSATEAFDKLKEAKKTISRVNEAMANASEEDKKAISKLGKSLQDSIATLQALYSEAPDTKGIVRTPGLLNETLRSTSRYINDSDGKPNQAAQFMLKKLMTQLGETLDKVNVFFEKDFAAYQKQVEAAKFSLFKPFSPIKIE